MSYRAGPCLWALLPALIWAACGEGPAEQPVALEQRDGQNAGPDTIAAGIDYTKGVAWSHARLAHGTCTEWKQRSDTLHSWLLRVNERLDRMRAGMEGRPSDDMNAADSVYRAKGDGERAYQELRTFYTLALRCAADSTALRRTKDLAIATVPSTAEAWRQACFAQQQRLESSHLLSRMSTEALLAENICLNSILKECERTVGGSPFPESDSTGGR